MVLLRCPSLPWACKRSSTQGKIVRPVHPRLTPIGVRVLNNCAIEFAFTSGCSLASYTR